MINLTQIEIDMIASLVIAAISVASNQAGDTLLGRMFAMVCLLAICGLAYYAYVQSRDVVFAAIALIATLLMLFFFVVLAARRK